MSIPRTQTQSPPAELQIPPIENFLATVLCSICRVGCFCCCSIVQLFQQLLIRNLL